MTDFGIVLMMIVDLFLMVASLFGIVLMMIGLLIDYNDDWSFDRLYSKSKEKEFRGSLKMACRQYYDGLCMGEDCLHCKYDESVGGKRIGNSDIAYALIAVGIFLAILMAGILW
jgi:hypothetical protein